MVTATLRCPQMFTFKDIMYKVVSDILKGADLDHLLWTDSTHSQYVAHRMLRSKRLQQMLLLLFLCAFPATWHTKSNFKKVQMVEIWTLTCNNSMVIYVTRCVQCLSLFLSGRADIKSERLNGRRKKSAWQRGAEVSLPPYLCFFFFPDWSMKIKPSCSRASCPDWKTRSLNSRVASGGNDTASRLLTQFFFFRKWVSHSRSGSPLCN